MLSINSLILLLIFFHRQKQLFLVLFFQLKFILLELISIFQPPTLFN